MKIPVQVFTTPSCVQCAATTRLMDKLGIIYDKVDLTQHPEALERFKLIGHTTAPIVVLTAKLGRGSVSRRSEA